MSESWFPSEEMIAERIETSDSTAEAVHRILSLIRDLVADEREISAKKIKVARLYARLYEIRKMETASVAEMDSELRRIKSAISEMRADAAERKSEVDR